MDDGAFVVGQRPSGEGRTDFAAALGALRDIGLDGHMAKECASRGGAENVLPRVARYLRSVSR